MQYKRILLIIMFSVLLLCLTTRVGSYNKNKQVKTRVLKPSLIPTLLPTPTPTPPFPVRIIIPKLLIDTAVEPVGNDEDGTMQLPQATDKVGWYIQGFKPGERGNAVIGGHLDLATGAPAVFYRLNELITGDIIVVQDAFGAQRRFEVVARYSYPYDKVPIDSVFGKSDSSQLNLITCSGVFNQSAQNYSERLILFSRQLE